MSRTYNTKKVYREHFGDIPEGRHIHHIDGDPTNDSPDNLIPVSRAMHKAMHEDRYKELGLKKDYVAAQLLGGTEYKHPGHSEQAKANMSKAAKTRKLSDEGRKKISEARKGNQNAKGYKHTDEARRKMSEAKKGRTPWNKGMKFRAF